MDSIRNKKLIEHFKLKYSDDLIIVEGKRRKFSVKFKSDLIELLKNTKLSQSEIADTIGVPFSVISKYLKKSFSDDIHSSEVKESTFTQLAVQNDLELKIPDGIYLQTQTGARVYGLSLDELTQLLRSL